MEKDQKSPANEIGISSEQIVTALQGFRVIAEAQQAAIEAWGIRLQALEKQVAEILNAIRRPGPSNPSVN